MSFDNQITQYIEHFCSTRELLYEPYILFLGVGMDGGDMGVFTSWKFIELWTYDTYVLFWMYVLLHIKSSKSSFEKDWPKWRPTGYKKVKCAAAWEGWLEWCCVDIVKSGTESEFDVKLQLSTFAAGE